MASIWFITGASRGIGRELTEQLLARGDRVAATLRHPEQLDDLAVVHGDRLWVRQLDVTDTMELGRVIRRHSTITSGLMWWYPMPASESSARQRT
jgi:NAD(P)-dependent dehydrogenase (short-subunit alcohol dehydrogenase family)